MTTHTYAGFVDHTGDAGFRAWGDALSTGLQAAGLVQTADTGQIDWVTVARPSTNTAGGYEIFRLPDSSLYFKIEYGTGSAAATPRLWVTVGAGSNGSGTLTGQLSTRSTWDNGFPPTSTSTNYTTYISVTDDHLAVCWSQNSQSSSSAFGGVLIVGKTVDSSGVATSDGYLVLRANLALGAGACSGQAVRLASPANTYSDSAFFSLVPGAPTSSLIAGNNQAYHCWMALPDMRPFLWAVSYVVAELADANTFSVPMVGATSHTYLTLGGTGANNNAATYGIAMLYE